MGKQYFKVTSRVGSGIMIAVICLALSFFMAGCGKTEAGDTGSSEQTKTAEPKASEGSDTITGLVDTPSDYSKKDNWMAIPEITHEVRSEEVV